MLLDLSAGCCSRHQQRSLPGGSVSDKQVEAPHHGTAYPAWSYSLGGASGIREIPVVLWEPLKPMTAPSPPHP